MHAAIGTSTYATNQHQKNMKKMSRPHPYDQVQCGPGITNNIRAIIYECHEYFALCMHHSLESSRMSTRAGKIPQMGPHSTY